MTRRLRTLESEILRRRRELAILEVKAVPLRREAPSQRHFALREPILDMDEIYAKLPDEFTAVDLAQVTRRAKPHVYPITTRWVKEKKVVRDKNIRGLYRKCRPRAAA